MQTPRFWQSRNWRSNLLLPAAWLYGIGAWLDHRFTVPQRAALPVICVGNATAGGAGKTPTTLALIPILRALGFTPHILSRGYGGSALQAHAVQPDDDWQQVGDEALLLAEKAPTWVGAQRVISARAAQQAGADLLVADDGLQHHALHKNLSLLVVDGTVGFGNERLLPAGPLREPLHAALKRCDAVIWIGEEKPHITGNIAKPIFRARFSSSGDIAWIADKKLLAFAGIAYPQKFYDSLKQFGGTLAATQDFPDHHAYTRNDIESLLQRAETLGAHLMTTAKDAVKIPPDLRDRIYVLHVALAFDDATTFTAWLQEKLLQQK